MNQSQSKDKYHLKVFDDKPWRASLEAIVDHIVATGYPIAVALFGSRARGDESESSDYDLYVEIPESLEAKGHQILKDLYVAIPLSLGVDVDFVVSTPGNFHKESQNVHWVQHRIKMNGICIYGDIEGIRKGDAVLAKKSSGGD